VLFILFLSSSVGVVGSYWFIFSGDKFLCLVFSLIDGVAVGEFSFLTFFLSFIPFFLFLSQLESPSKHRRFPVNKILQTAENKRRLPLICCSFPLLLLIQCRFIHLFCRWCWVVLGGGVWGGLLFFFFASFYALILLPFFLFFIFIILFLIRVVIVMHLTVHPLLGFLFSR